MKYEPSSIVTEQNRQTQQCVVRAETHLRDVVSLLDLDSVAHILVQNSDGHLIGIVETELILRRLSAENRVERLRWESMPIESALQWKISPVEDSSATGVVHSSLPISCTAVHTTDGVSALVSDGDVFVSWQVVRQSLSEAMTDSVTSLPNRLTFERRLQEEMSRAARDHHSIAVILFDVDHFKEVNDQYGHSVGDAALYEIASGLERQLRSYDVLARYGGDEFSAICCGCAEGEIDIPIARILTQIPTSFSKTAVALPKLTLSIGAAVVHDVLKTDRAEDLIELADLCLYRSKDNGRDSAFKVELPSFRHASSKPVQVLAQPGLTATPVAVS